jgi:DNA invertase Pin-like site-specific DNA recombinase
MHRKELGQWLTDPAKLVQYDAIVFYAVDRISRGSDEDFSRIESWASQNGKRLVAVAAMDGGIQFPSRGDADYWQWTAMKRQAGQEWEVIRERIWRARKAITDQGGLMGRAIWGYEIQGDRYGKRLVPTDTCRAYWPQVLTRIAQGDSLRKVAQWLDSEGVATDTGKRWNEGTLGSLVKSPTYRGERKQQYPVVDCDQPHAHTRRCPKRQVEKVIECEPVVTRDLWYSAREALQHRTTRQDTGGRPSAAPALLKSMTCGHPECNASGTELGPSPMYRIATGKDGNRAYYYRCTGRGAQRRGRGNMIPLAAVDQAVLNRIAYLSSEPELRTVTVKGRDVTAEIEGLTADLRALDVMADDFIERAAAMKAEIGQLAALPPTADVVKQQPTGRTIGQAFRELDHNGKRAWLAGHDIRAWSDNTGIWISIDGVTISPDQTSLGVDHWHLLEGSAA